MRCIECGREAASEHFNKKSGRCNICEASSQTQPHPESVAGISARVAAIEKRLKMQSHEEASE